MLEGHKIALKALEQRHAARAKSVSYHLATRVVKAKATAQDESAFQQAAFKELSGAAVKHSAVLKSAHRAGAITGRHHAKQEIASYGLKVPVVPITDTSPYTAAAKEALSTSTDAALGKVYDAASPEEARGHAKELVRRAAVAAAVVANRAYTDQQLAMYKQTALANPDKTFEKVWATNPNSDPCPECIALDGTSVGLWDEFPFTKDLAVFQNDQSGPPRHPNCRCRLVLRVVDKASGLDPLTNLSMPSDEEFEAWVMLHGHKGQPGYFLLHDPDKKKADAANAIYKVFGQHAITPVSVAKVMEGYTPQGAVPSGTLPSRLTNPKTGEPVKLQEGEHATAHPSYDPYKGTQGFAIHHADGSITHYSKFTDKPDHVLPGTTTHAAVTKSWTKTIAKHVPDAPVVDAPAPSAPFVTSIDLPNGEKYEMKPGDAQVTNHVDGSVTPDAVIVKHGDGSVTEWLDAGDGMQAEEYPAGTPNADYLIKAHNVVVAKAPVATPKSVVKPDGSGSYVLQPGEKEVQAPNNTMKVVVHADGAVTVFMKHDTFQHEKDSESAKLITKNVSGGWKTLQSVPKAEPAGTPGKYDVLKPDGTYYTLKPGEKQLSGEAGTLVNGTAIVQHVDGSLTSWPGGKYLGAQNHYDNGDFAEQLKQNLPNVIAEHPMPPSTVTPSAVVEGLPVDIPSVHGGNITVTPQSLSEAIAALKNQAGIYVKQPLAKIDHPLQHMDYHAVAAAHAEAGGKKLVGKDKTKQAVIAHLEHKLAFATAPPPPVTTSFGGVDNLTVEHLKAAHKTLSDAKGIMVKQPLTAANHPLQHMDYHSVASAHVEKSGTTFVGKDKTKQAVLGALDSKIKEMESGKSTPSETPKAEPKPSEPEKFYYENTINHVQFHPVEGKPDTYDLYEANGDSSGKGVTFGPSIFEQPHMKKVMGEGAKPKKEAKPSELTVKLDDGSEMKVGDSFDWDKTYAGPGPFTITKIVPPGSSTTLGMVHFKNANGDVAESNAHYFASNAKQVTASTTKDKIPVGAKYYFTPEYSGGVGSTWTKVGKNKWDIAYDDGGSPQPNTDFEDSFIEKNVGGHYARITGDDSLELPGGGTVHVGDVFEWKYTAGSSVPEGKNTVTGFKGSFVEYENASGHKAKANKAFYEAHSMPPKPKQQFAVGDWFKNKSGAGQTWEITGIDDEAIHAKTVTGGTLFEHSLPATDFEDNFEKMPKETPKPAILYKKSTTSGLKYFPKGDDKYDVYDSDGGLVESDFHKTAFPTANYEIVYDTPGSALTPTNAPVSTPAKVSGDTNYYWANTETGLQYHKNPDGTWAQVDSNGVMVVPSMTLIPNVEDSFAGSSDWKKIEKGVPGSPPEQVQPKKKAKGAKAGALSPSDLIEKWPLEPPTNNYSAKAISAQYKQYVDQLGLNKIAITPGFIDKNEKSMWLQHMYNGDFAKAYQIELSEWQYHKHPGEDHPAKLLHPGSPDNPLNGGSAPAKVATPAAVDGEIPAGSPVPGNWPESSYSFDAEQIDAYLLAAGMKNAHGLGQYQKKQWVSTHKDGNKKYVDTLSLQAQTNVQNGNYQSEELLPPKPVVPVGQHVTVDPAWKPFNPELNHAINLDDKQTNDYLSNLLTPMAYKKAKQQDLKTRQAIVQQHWLAGNLAAGAEKDKATVNAKAVLHELEVSAESGSEPKLPVFGEKHSFSLKPKQPNLPGTSQKHIVLDEHGNEWLFKYDKEGGWRAEVENAAHNAGNFFGFGTAAAQTGKFQGSAGLFQAMVPNDGDVSSVQPHLLTEKQLKDIASEHLLDWALDNDDAHNQNFLQLPNGHVLGIDKGRSWKHMGNASKPHSLNFPGSMSGNAHLYYEDLYKDIANGKIDQPTADAIYRHVMARATSMARKPDDRYRAILEAGLKDRPGYSKTLVDSIIARKNALPEDFDKLWGSVYAQAGWEKPELGKGQLENHYIGTSPEYIDAVKANGSHGKAAFFGGTHLEDGHLISWETHPKIGAPSLQSMGTLRKDADDKLMKWIKEHGGGQLSVSSSDYGTPTPPKSGATKQAEEWHQTVLAAAKTVSHHQMDKEYNAQKLDALEELKTKLGNIDGIIPADVAPHEYDQYHDMVDHYLGQIAFVEKLKEEANKSKPGDIAQFSWQDLENPLGDDSAGAPALKVNYTITTETGTLPSGKTNDEGKFVSNGTFSQGQPHQEYKIELGSGVTIRYVPWSAGQKAHQGRLHVEVENYGDSSTGLDSAIDVLREAGVEMDPATESDLELLYWRHLHGVISDRIDGQVGQKYHPLTKAGKEIHAQNLGGGETELSLWRKAFSDQFGAKLVDDWVASAGYMPRYSHNDTRRPGEENGHPYWHRFDVTPEQLASKNFTSHSLGKGDDSAVNIVKSGALLSTEERSRVLGGWYPGSSSSSDQGHGSSNFLFARQNLTGHVNVNVSLEAALRTSVYSFSGDNYGEIENRKTSSYFDFDKQTQYADYGNEMMYKQALSVLDDIEMMSFSDEVQRNLAIQHLKDNGITEIRGVPVEERLILSSGYASQLQKLLAKKRKELTGHE